MTQKIIPNLWLDGRAEEAATFYTSLFDGSRITNVMRFHEVGSEIHGQAPGSVSTVDFETPASGWWRSTEARSSPSRPPSRFS